MGIGSQGKALLATDLNEYVRQAVRVVDRALDEWMPRPPEVPAQLASAMRHAVFPGGKRLRPVLTLMSCEACGGRVEDALPAACAVELIHCYSLVHDDLPAMDNADLRRGRPTVHVVFDEATAVLAGDALLTYAFELLARHVPDQDVLRESVLELAQAAGPAGMVGGQMEDWLGTGTDGATEARLQRIHELKTGALLRAAVRLGAIAARANATQRNVLDRYAESLGLAFQITDDLLDVVGDPQRLGKPVHQDEKKLSFPGVLGIEKARRRVEELVAEACRSAAALGPAAGLFQQLARYVAERNR